MKKISFNVNENGFYGVYWENKIKSDSALIAMLGDDPSDYLAKGCVKWLQKNGMNVMTMSPAKKDYGHHNYPLERIEKAIMVLKKYGNTKIGIVGASTTGMLALVAASYFSDITLTIAMTPSDFIWQGFMQGNKDGCKEWPVERESTVSWQGKPLAYVPFAYKHPDYWKVIEKETKGSGNFLCSRKLFDDSEKAYPITEKETIKVENIYGKLFLIGADDDTLWDTGKYIRRMDERLKSTPHKCDYEAIVYEYGTHFVFPETLIKALVPGFSKIIMKFIFKSVKEYADECQKTRIDIDLKLKQAMQSWSKK
ncbi:acyl-CoA thioester hydrolase/BAAT C-terminal domain-containing protein [Ruminococcus sp.]|uniref:acyl-CoA thioester hydrolase/BAAT C-terminal domain-containing protein n=1 Tax=Ruminococcus sp. TaxID=41978 RepID=UPI00386FF55F